MPNSTERVRKYRALNKLKDQMRNKEARQRIRENKELLEKKRLADRISKRIKRMIPEVREKKRLVDRISYSKRRRIKQNLEDRLKKRISDKNSKKRKRMLERIKRGFVDRRLKQKTQNHLSENESRNSDKQKSDKMDIESVDDSPDQEKICNTCFSKNKITLEENKQISNPEIQIDSKNEQNRSYLETICQSKCTLFRIELAETIDDQNVKIEQEKIKLKELAPKTDNQNVEVKQKNEEKHHFIRNVVSDDPYDDWKINDEFVNKFKLLFLRDFERNILSIGKIVRALMISLIDTIDVDPIVFKWIRSPEKKILTEIPAIFKELDAVLIKPEKLRPNDDIFNNLESRFSKKCELQDPNFQVYKSQPFVDEKEVSKIIAQNLNIETKDPTYLVKKVQLEQTMTANQIKCIKKEFLARGVEINFSDTKSFEIEYKSTFSSNLLRKHGYISSVLKNANINTNYSIENVNLFPAKDITYGDNCPRDVKILNTYIRKMISINAMTPHKAKKVLLKKFNKVEQSEVFYTIIKSLEKLYANTTREYIEPGDIEIFENEPLLKTEVVNQDYIYLIFYSNDVVNKILEGVFDVLFVDGTHIKNSNKFQLIIVRLYSKNTSEIANAAYVLTNKKTQLVYSLIFEKISKTGILKNVKFVITDFELGFRNAIEKICAPSTDIRLCYFHFHSAMRQYNLRMKKYIAIQTKQKVDSTSYIHVLFSYLMFIGPDKKVTEMAFELFKLIVLSHKPTLANFGFCSYIKRTYIGNGRFSNMIFSDISKLNITTNNSIEAINGSMKKFMGHHKGIDGVLEWISYNTKEHVIGLKKASFDPKIDLQIFQQDFGLNENWMQLIISKISNLGNFAQKNNRISKDSFIEHLKLFKFKSFGPEKTSHRFTYNKRTFKMDSVEDYAQYFSKNYPQMDEMENSVDNYMKYEHKKEDLETTCDFDSDDSENDQDCVDRFLDN